jgi:phosphohistidine phosphatase
MCSANRRERIAASTLTSNATPTRRTSTVVRVSATSSASAGPVRTLVLLRHAKSDYPPDVADHQRPLAGRGVREAGLAGEWIRANVAPVDAVLCSTATRTRQTFARTGVEAPVQYVDRLYDATPGAVIDEINGVAGRFEFDVHTLLVIGHEPAMSHVALGLAAADSSNAAAAEHISTKFPTSSVAVLRTSGPWEALTLSSAALVTFHVPR